MTCRVGEAVVGLRVEPRVLELPWSTAFAAAYCIRRVCLVRIAPARRRCRRAAGGAARGGDDDDASRNGGIAQPSQAQRAAAE